MMNEQIVKYIVNTIKLLDEDFKNSNERKKQYYINKSNVDRCIVTIFGELKFNRTLYKNKFTGEYFNYIDEKFNIEYYKTYDPIVRAILVKQSVISNPNNTSNNSPLDIFKYYLETYNTNEDYIYNGEKDVNYSMFEKSISNIPTIASNNPISLVLNAIAYPIF